MSSRQLSFCENVVRKVYLHVPLISGKFKKIKSQIGLGLTYSLQIVCGNLQVGGQLARFFFAQRQTAILYRPLGRLRSSSTDLGCIGLPNSNILVMPSSAAAF